MDLLSIRNVSIAAGDRPIVRDLSLAIPAGETHVLFGPNGSGKSCLLSAVMGLAPFRVTEGAIWFDGERIDALPVDERARLGIGMAFQRPPSLGGVSVAQFARALNAQAALAAEAAALDLLDFSARDINVGFSGGELKRWEVLKLFLQRPRLCLFDEPESGVDLEHVAAVGNAIGRLTRAADGPPRSALVITHTGFILDYLQADRGHLMVDGRIVESDDPRVLFDRIRKQGYGVPERKRSLP